MWSRNRFIEGCILVMVSLAVGACGASKASSSSSSPPPAPAALACNSKTGLTQPLSVCSAASPCTNGFQIVNGTFKTGVTLTTTSEVPTCATGNGILNDGPPMAWQDADGVTHYTCLFIPNGTNSSTSKRPLVIFFHGGGGNASSVYDQTGLRVKADTNPLLGGGYDLSGDSARPGFILASVQGRNLLWPSIRPSGSYHDNYYRDMNSPSSNPDVAHVDHLIDTLVAQGADPQQIYTMGWSNGAEFAQFYAIARHDTPTPGGNHVAAAAVYAFANPFANIDWNQSPSCELDPYPKSEVPIYLVNRACDSYTACSTAQQTAFNLEPGFSAEEWFTQIKDPAFVGDSNVQFQRLDPQAQPVAACTDLQPASGCTVAFGTREHLTWPGLYDTNNDWEPTMLDFLKAHPHP